MKLRRLEVEGGFLDGLDLHVTDGLNVLVGSRGSGKTSVIELIRFCLDVAAVTDEAQRVARSHALAVLGDGCVIVTAEVAGTVVTLRRYANADGVEAEPQIALGRPLLVSQSEIEAIGLDGDSRRRILDGLIADQPAGGEDEHAILREAEETARRLGQMVAERDEVLNQLEKLAAIPDELESAEAQQKAAGEASAELASLQEEIRGLSDSVGRLQARSGALERSIAALDTWLRELGAVETFELPLPELPADARASVAPVLEEAREALRTAVRQTTTALRSLQSHQADGEHELLEQQRRLRELSKKVEELQEGAGALARRVGGLRQQMQARESLLSRSSVLDESITKLVQQRSGALDRLDDVREKRFRRRLASAEAINEQFDGEIDVRVHKAGAFAEYAAALGTALQGSGLQYKALAQDIAERMSPRELVEAVERNDVDHIATASAITVDRASRLAAHLRARGTTDVLLAPVDDVVDFALLDGQDYKTTANLSMGQRCTVVLPLLLAQPRQLTVLDQPEDHLDNAFIVDTVVRALRQRTTGSQFLIATHNPNVPVLGEADQVILMASNGRQGFVDNAAALDDDRTVEAITRLMEGGEEAFQRRASFYAEHH